MSTTRPTQHFVTFDSIGLVEDPTPLLTTADNPLDLGKAIHRYAAQTVSSRDVEVQIDEDSTVAVFQGALVIACGKSQEVITLCRDETCPSCGYPEMVSIVPSVDGWRPELLAIHCRSCGGFFVEGGEQG